MRGEQGGQERVKQIALERGKSKKGSYMGSEEGKRGRGIRNEWNEERDKELERVERGKR
jgi:hypothetical protein